MRKPKAPCQGCKERTSECHAHCERFEHYQEEKKEWFKEREKFNILASDSIAYQDAKSKRLEKRRGIKK